MVAAAFNVFFQPMHFVERGGDKLMEQSSRQAPRLGHRTKAFAIAVTLHVLLAAAAIYLVVPPLPQPEKKESIIEIVQLPEPPKPQPPKPIPQPVVKPVPVPAAKPIAKPRPAPPPVIATPAPPVPTFVPVPMQEAPEPPQVVEQAPVEAPPPVMAQPPVDEYIPPDSDAAYLHNPKPAYPLIAQKRGWEGVTLLEVRVSAAGKPLSVRILKTSGHQVLDDVALRTVQDAYRFEPARRNGEKIEATVELPIRFSLRK